MQRDLGYLPAWYAKSEDYVYMEEGNIGRHIHFLRSAFSAMPQPVTNNSLSEISPAELCCWGISPHAIHVFEMLNVQYGAQLTLPVWNNQFHYLSSREVAADILATLAASVPGISSSLAPQYAESMEDSEKIIAHSSVPLVVKSPYSSSGRGLLWLRNGLGNKERELLRGMLKKQKRVSIEPVLNKKIDFSMQFMTDGKGNIHFEGLSIFHTNEKGAYLGSLIATQEKILSQIIEWLPEQLLFSVKTALIRILGEKYASLYKGCLGVDMMVYEENGQWRIHPCVEINMRHNMGFLATQIAQNHIVPTSSGIFRIDFHSHAGEVLRIHQELQRRHPLKITDGKIASGYLSLCEIDAETKYHGYVVVGG